MSWKCWFSEHKWIDAIDEQYLQCERCPKLSQKPKPPREIPSGSRPCIYRGCEGWVALPPYFQIVDGHKQDLIIVDTICSFCKKGVRWNKTKTDNYRDWNGPWARELDNKYLPDGVIYKSMLDR